MTDKRGRTLSETEQRHCGREDTMKDKETKKGEGNFFV